MRPTRLARNIRWLASAVLLTALGTSIAAQTHDSGTLVLDLTKPPTREEQGVSGSVGPGIAGSSVSVIGDGHGQLQPRPYSLPLVVKLQSISPQQFGPGGKLTAEVVLENTGTANFYLPASRNSVAVLKQGNKGRRTFLFSLVFEDAKHGRKLSFLIGSSDGSETLPDSFLRLDPHHSVRVLLAGGLNSTADQTAISEWLKAGVKELRVRAEVKEWKYENKRYFIENSSEPVVSGNALAIELR